jgi:hypothetical protein
MSYAIRFDYPETPNRPIYAGMHKGALGWAPTLATALLYDDAETATRVLANGYGRETQSFGTIIEVEAENAP